MPADSYRVPWIEYRYAQIGEVFDVARRERKAMFERRGCDHALSDAKRTSDLLTLSVQSAPALGNRLGYRKHALAKPCWNKHLYRVLNLRPLSAWGSSSAPLRNSPTATTLINCEAMTWLLSHAATLDAGFARQLSEGMLVSRRNPLMRGLRDDPWKDCG